MWLPFSVEAQLMLLELPVLHSHSPVPPEGRYSDLPFQEQSIGHSSTQNIFPVKISCWMGLLLIYTAVQLRNPSRCWRAESVVQYLLPLSYSLVESILVLCLGGYHFAVEKIMPRFIVERGWAQVAAKCCTVFTVFLFLFIWVHKQLLMNLGLAQPFCSSSFSTCFALIIDFSFVLGHLTWKDMKFQAPRETSTGTYSDTSNLCNFGYVQKCLYARGTWKWDPGRSYMPLKKTVWCQMTEPSLVWGTSNDKDVGVISEFLVTPVKAAVAQSAGDNQPFVCPCALAGGRLSTCSCEMSKCTCLDGMSLPLFLFSSPRKYGTSSRSRHVLAVLGTSAPSTLFSWATPSDGILHLVLGIINSELGRIWTVNKCSSVFRPAQFLAHFLFIILSDECFRSHIKRGVVSARGCVAWGAPQRWAGC